MKRQGRERGLKGRFEGVPAMCCNCSLLVHCCNVLMQWSIQIHVPSTGMGPDELTIVVLNHRWGFLVSSPPLTCQTDCTPARSNLLHKPQFSFCCCSVRRLGTPAPPEDSSSIVLFISLQPTQIQLTLITWIVAFIFTLV